ncbi:Complement C3 [Acipenser ruthenus]|uniref:Complement C3 n=1 Tax=Acipenser ruthenus TaxID=7906 RepID=A0A444U838_ACIRT|nr:Complement C3 [Acipenser ruthenus]
MFPASKYKDETQNKCCRDGMNDIPMDYSCEKRAQYITAGDECIKAFLHCCTEISKRKKEMHTGTLELSRSYGILSILSCSLSSTKVKGTLKDSITEWEILAISISPDKGICVAKPFDLIAKMEFFIDLKLPYSVVRNEQVEIKAVLYNYGSDRLKVRVDLMENSLICSAASHKTRFRQDVYIDELSSLAIPFTIVPLHLGEMDIEVKAIVYNNILSDGVKKKLLVVLTNQVDQYIQNYVIERELTNGSLIIHLYRVPHKSLECISFNIHQMFKVGMLQPAAITIYEYYSPVYKVRVEEIDLSKGYDEYTMEVVEVIKQGTDVFHDDRKRTYTAHSSCRQPLDLRKGRQYLIMGNTRDLWSIKEKLTYIIGGTTWVEWWPTKEESQTEESRIVYLGINDFVSELMEYGCSN